MTLVLSELVINGQSAESAHSNVLDALLSLEMLETIEGASTVTMTLSDPYRVLARSPLASAMSTVIVDNAGFSLASVSQRGSSLTLVFEDIAVAALRLDKTPRKVNAYSQSRVEFITTLIKTEQSWIKVHARGGQTVAREELTRGKPPSSETGYWSAESTWEAGTRIMEAIQGRMFARRGAIYLYTDPELMGGMLNVGGVPTQVGAGATSAPPVLPNSVSLRALLTRVGFSGNRLDIAVAVAMAESKGNAKAHNFNTSTGDDSYGLFQINMLGNLGPERRDRYGLQQDSELLDPVKNATIAYSMSKKGLDWTPWSTYKSGAYRQFMGKDCIVTGVASPGKAVTDDGVANTDTTATGSAPVHHNPGMWDQTPLPPPRAGSTWSTRWFDPGVPTMLQPPAANPTGAGSNTATAATTTAPKWDLQGGDDPDRNLMVVKDDTLEIGTPVPTKVAKGVTVYQVREHYNGVQDIDYTFDTGQLEATCGFDVQTTWRDFFPGQVVEVLDQGTATGFWLVKQVRRTYGSAFAHVDLTQPNPTLVEPIGKSLDLQQGDLGTPGYNPDIAGTIFGSVTTVVGPTPGVSAPGTLPASGTNQIGRIFTAAKAEMGKPYGYGATGPDSWDCSSFARHCAETVGISLPRTARAQYEYFKSRGTIIPLQEAIDTPGAWLFKIVGGASSRFHSDHVAISKGDGTTYEAMGTAYGCRSGSAYGRGFTAGGLVPGVTYGSLGGGAGDTLGTGGVRGNG